MRQKQLLISLKIVISFIVLGSVSLFAEAAALNQSINKHATSGTNIVEDWKHFDDTDIKKPSNGLSSVVVFRPLDNLKGPAVNLYIDGEYQASVLAGAYTQTFFCPGSHHFSIAYTNVLKKYKAKKRVDHKNTFISNTITYYEINRGSNQKPKIQVLSEEKALTLIKALPPRQRHTISRLNKRECPKRK